MNINNINLSSLTDFRERLSAGIRRTGSLEATETEKIQDQDNVNAPLAAKKQINPRGDPGSKALLPDRIPSKNHNIIKIAPFDNIEEVVEAAGELELFKQSEAFVHGEMPELERFFRVAVTTIGVTDPEELGAFLAEFSGSGIAANAGFRAEAAGFMKAAQVIAQHAPGAMESFISGSEQLLTDSPENLGNYFSRIAEVAVQFGSEEAGTFAGLFNQSPDEPGASLEPEIMDEFFAASDAIRSGGREYYSMFLDRIASDLETQELDGKQAVIYLEYAAGLAKRGNFEELEILLNTPIHTFAPSAASTGTSSGVAVNGVDMTVELATTEFGGSDADKTNSADVRIESSGMKRPGDPESKTESGGILQTIFLQEGMHVKGNQPVDIRINVNYELDIITKTKSGRQHEFGIIENIFNEIVDENENEVTLTARLVEIDGGNRNVLTEVLIDTKRERPDDVDDVSKKVGINEERVFEDVELEPGKNYIVELVVENTLYPIPMHESEAYGKVTMNNLFIDFENNPDYRDRLAIDQRDVPQHTVYLTSEDFKEFQDVLRRIDTNNDPKKITDQDLAEEQSQMTELMIRQQSGTTALAQANLDPGMVINILA